MTRTLSSTCAALALGAALAAALPACASAPWWKPERPTPLADVTRIAVAPAMISGNVDKDLQQRLAPLAQSLANELAELGRFRVVRPAEVLDALRREHITLRTGEDALKLARSLKVDALLVVEVTDYAPYPPPRLGAAVQLFSTRTDIYPVAADYVVLAQLGRPLKIEGSLDQIPAVSFESMVDLANVRTEESLELYAGTRAYRPLGAQAYSMVTSGFLRFAARELVAETLELDCRRQEEALRRQAELEREEQEEQGMEAAQARR